MVKELGPLEKVTKEGDTLRKQVDKFVKESVKNANNKKLKDKEIKLKANFRSCYEIKLQVVNLLKQAEELSEENEEKKQQKNFETKKKKEVDRITTWQTQLDDAMTKLLSEEEKEAYEKELKKELGGGEEEEESEGEEEDSEEEDDDEEGEVGEDTVGEDTLAETAKTEGDEDEDDDDDDDDDVVGDETLEDPKPTPKKGPAKIAEVVESEEDEDDDEDEDSEDEGIDEDETVPMKVAQSKASPKAKSKPEVVEESEEEEDESEGDEDEDEEEDSEEEEEDDGQTTLEVTTSGRLFQALYDFTSEEDGDLNFKKGEILTIIQTQEDGWWEAENENKETGNVPSTYLKMFESIGKKKKVKDTGAEEDEDEEDEEEEESEGDEDEEDEEQEEEEAVTKKKSKHRKSGKELWGNVRKVVKESSFRTGVTDVLHALGAVPSGFRASTLANKLNSDFSYQMKNYLTPKLSSSNYSYRDLFFDPSENKIRSRMVREQRILTISSCKQIPVPGAGLELTSRHVRICLFDGQNVLSNIHTVKVASVDKDQRTWSFSTRINDFMDTYQHAEVFLRTDNVQKNIGILFELCASYERTSTKEYGEFSCGWSHLPLEEATTGLPIQNKSHDLLVNGGTPYEKGIEVDPSISRRTSSNSFMSLLSGNKQPRLIIKLSVPKKEQKEMLDTLPDTLIGNTVLLQFYSLHRQILADTLLRDRLDLESTEIIHSPWLNTFPMVADQHDLMKLLRETWFEKIKGARRAEMNQRDHEYMKDMFKKTIMESVYSLVHSANLPSFKSGDYISLQARHEEIEKFKNQKLSKRSLLALLCSADMVHTPVDMKEVSFNVIGPYCLTHHTKQQIAVES